MCPWKFWENLMSGRKNKQLQAKQKREESHVLKKEWLIYLTQDLTYASGSSADPSIAEVSSSPLKDGCQEAIPNEEKQVWSSDESKGEIFVISIYRDVSKRGTTVSVYLQNIAEVL